MSEGKLIIAAADKELETEWLLMDNPNRFVLFPIQHEEIWEMYKLAEISFWTAEEVDLASDLNHWKNKLNKDERHFIKHVLAFFANSDGIVNDNLLENFSTEVKIPEARCFYGFQIAIENIHAEMYSVLIDTLVKNPVEKQRLFSAIYTIPSITKKAEWALKWIHNDASFGQRLVAYAIVEGVQFSSSFCSIFWLKKRGLMPGLCFSNELISRDELLHTKFSCLLFSYLVNKGVNQQEFDDMMREAVDYEIDYVKEGLKVDLIGINQDMMALYVRYVANRVAEWLGFEPIYSQSEAYNPFDWMIMMDCDQKSNLMERQNSQYQLNIDDEAEFVINDDF